MCWDLNWNHTYFIILDTYQVGLSIVATLRYPSKFIFPTILAVFFVLNDCLFLDVFLVHWFHFAWESSKWQNTTVPEKTVEYFLGNTKVGREKLLHDPCYLTVSFPPLPPPLTVPNITRYWKCSSSSSRFICYAWKFNLISIISNNKSSISYTLLLW